MLEKLDMTVECAHYWWYDSMIPHYIYDKRRDVIFWELWMLGFIKPKRQSMIL